MVLIVSDKNEVFGRTDKVVASIGQFTHHTGTEGAITNALRSKPSAIIIFAFDREKASHICRDIKSVLPDVTIIAICDRDANAPVRFSEIDGSDRQLLLPCSDEDIAHELRRIHCPDVTYECLNVGPDRKNVTYLGYALKLSVSEYFVLRYLALNRNKSVSASEIRTVCFRERVKESCVTVHISNINKKASVISGRKLIVFDNGYLLNPDM